MADLDSRAKRASAIGIDLPWQAVYPNPDGVIDQQDRQQAAYKYYGISSLVAVGATVSAYRMMMGLGS